MQEQFYGRPIKIADRYLVEDEGDTILEKAIDEKIAFLVVGDPLG